MAPSLPKEYTVASFEAKDEKLTFKKVPLKLPEAGQVLVKVLACGVCHSDAMVQQATIGNSYPIVPGHEIVGDVAAVPDSEKTWKVGDRVGGGWHGSHDGTCKACKRGLFQMCSNETVNGVMRDGGYGEYVTLSTEAVVNVPSSVDPAEYAPLLCAGVTVFNGLRQQKVLAGELVAVQGLGGLGHLAIQYANKMGYKTVALSSSGAKENFARDLGAHEYIDSSKESVGEALQKLGGAACVILTAPVAELIAPILTGLGPGGKLLVLAVTAPVQIEPASMIRNGLSIVAWPSGHALDSEEAVDFAMRHHVHCLVEKFKFQDANKAFEVMLSGKVRFRAVLTMD